MIDFEIKVKDLIVKNNISIKKLCDKIGMSYQNLRIIFQRDSLETKHLEKIAEVLGVKPEYFFGVVGGEIKNQMVINSNHGEVNHTKNVHSSIGECEREIEFLKRENEGLSKQIKLLEKLVSSLERD